MLCSKMLCRSHLKLNKLKIQRIGDALLEKALPGVLEIQRIGDALLEEALLGSLEIK